MGSAFLRGPPAAFLAARDELLAVLKYHNLEPELVVMDRALRQLREDEHWHFCRARNSWAIQQLGLWHWQRTTMANIDC